MADNEIQMTEEERAGVEAIIYLQSLAGIDEPQDVALKNWRNFSQWEKSNTMAAYSLFHVDGGEEE